MALRVFQFVATIPPSTQPTAPATTIFDLDNWELESLDLEVPAGPNGVVGFYVVNNGVQWIPQPAGEWLIWTDQNQSWTFEDQPNASGWGIVGYNEGFYQHSVTARFHVNPPGSSTPATLTPQVTIVTSDIPAADPVTL